jgi:eukaryotic-like serine/threonine-protein kinase
MKNPGCPLLRLFLPRGVIFHVTNLAHPVSSKGETAGEPMPYLGHKIDNIRVTAFLGQGGMGDVYAGFDEKLRRKVALKSIRPDCRGSTARARFLREARSLSQLSHPNICGIYDYIEGTEGDFLVLELIHGETLRTALDRGLEPAAKLRVAEQVADALMAAHVKGIVHRDLKMANVMLTEDGKAKILDFGIAQLPREQGTPAEAMVVTGWDRAAAEETLGMPARPGGTAIGLLVGTLACMSPEQARGEPLTAASDMFSFGLFLQELMTGSPAYDANLPMHLLIGQVSRGETRPVTGIDPGMASLVQSLQAVAPAARPSAEQALRRLRRIRDKPRRRLRLLAAAGAVLLLGLGAAKYTLDLRRERDAAVRARQAGESSRAETEEVARFLEGLFAVADPGQARGQTITAREILDRGARGIERDLHGQPLRRARLLAIIGKTYLKLGLYDRARPLLAEALAVRQSALGNDSAEMAVSLRDLAALDQAQGRLAEAEPRFRQALAIQEKVLGPGHPEVAATLNNLGTLYGYQGEAAKAEPLFRRALKIRERALGPGHPDVAATLNNLAFIRSMQGHPDEAVALLRRGLAIREVALAPDHPDLAANLEALAVLESGQGGYADAERLHRRALAIWTKTLGPDHPRIGLVLANLAATCAGAGKPVAAEALYRQAIALRERVLGPEHPDLALVLRGLADLLRDGGRYAEAEPLYLRAMAIQEKTLPPQSRVRQDTVAGYRKLLAATGRMRNAVY